ncbi:hypothetical protein [Actinomadura rubrisoli]|uniref:Guanylate cyclase domain-containing protein n=1 Tax=Actinomadura rubrisoli TaxID=2530368 RepID=A0A4R5A5R8_9ACTN|nr:hypothetical protein [Actinomadura rubrisoli]TDD64912.1 hypothetical protein E1298_41935 [Actinomadura rubrisoli]
MQPSSPFTTLLATDLVAFGAQYRDIATQVQVRHNMYARVIEALTFAGVSWPHCHHEDRGDGTFIVTPPEAHPAVFLDPMLNHLSAAVGRHNRCVGPPGRMRLRVAVHHGPVHYDGYGVTGPDTLLLFRLLEAPRFKRKVHASGSELAAIVSDTLYTNAFDRNTLINPAAYRATRLTHKETRRVRAWLWFPPQ